MEKKPPGSRYNREADVLMDFWDSGDILLNSLRHFLGNRVTGLGEDHSYCRPWVDHVHLALIDKMTGRSLHKGRPRTETGGFHELIDTSPDCPKSGVDPAQTIHYNEQ